MNCESYKEIYNQLGGNRFTAMTGARLSHGNEGRTLNCHIKGSRKYNFISITHNGLDLYDVKFIKFGGPKSGFRTIREKEFKDIYNDMLKTLIEKETGLYLSL